MLQSVPSVPDLDNAWLLDAADAEANASPLDYIQTSRHHPPPMRLYKAMLPAAVDLVLPRSNAERFKSDIATETETRIRHASWMRARSKLLTALRSDPASERRALRLEGCGRSGRFQITADGKSVRIFAYYCGDRLCRRCSLSRACRMAKNVESFTARKVIRFVTLTRRTDRETLAEAIAGLRRSFQRVVRTEFWKEKITGTIWFYEITRGLRGDHWHCHIHGLCSGEWFSARDLSRTWERSSNGSYIVDVRRANNQDEIAWYCTTYAAQILDEDILNNPSLTLEAAHALRSVRLCGTHGLAVGTRLLARSAQKEEWKTVGTVDQVVTDAARGEPYAVGLMKAVRRSVEITRDGELSIQIDKHRDASICRSPGRGDPC